MKTLTEIKNRTIFAFDNEKEIGEMSYYDFIMTYESMMRSEKQPRIEETEDGKFRVYNNDKALLAPYSVEFDTEEEALVEQFEVVEEYYDNTDHVDYTDAYFDTKEEAEEYLEDLN